MTCELCLSGVGRLSRPARSLFMELDRDLEVLGARESSHDPGTGADGYLFGDATLSDVLRGYATAKTGLFLLLDSVSARCLHPSLRRFGFDLAVLNVRCQCLYFHFETTVLFRVMTMRALGHFHDVQMNVTTLMTLCENVPPVTQGMRCLAVL